MENCVNGDIISQHLFLLHFCSGSWIGCGFCSVYSLPGYVDAGCRHQKHGLFKANNKGWFEADILTAKRSTCDLWLKNLLLSIKKLQLNQVRKIQIKDDLRGIIFKIIPLSFFRHLILRKKLSLYIIHILIVSLHAYVLGRFSISYLHVYCSTVNYIYIYRYMHVCMYVYQFLLAITSNYFYLWERSKIPHFP